MALEAARSGASGGLPTVRAMARQTGASVFTVSHALGVLAREGVVVVVRGRGAYTPEQAAQRQALQQNHTPHSPAAPKWQTVRERIEHDTLTGVFAQGTPLPSVRELALRYFVSTPTIRRALSTTSSSPGTKPHIQPWASTGSSVRTHSALLLVTESDSAGRPVFVNQRNHDFFWQLEREGARRGLAVHLQTITRDSLGESHVKRVCSVVGRAIASRTTAAVVLVAEGFERPQEVASGLSAAGLPLAVLDERQRVSPPQTSSRRAPVCIVSMESSTAPGMKVGQLLRSLGHRRVAYLTDAPEGAWSVQRLEGLAEVLAGGSVTPYGQMPAATTSLSAHIGRAVAALPHTVRSRFAQHQAAFLASESTRAAMLPLFERALQDRAATAWVAVHDPVALLALEFLEEHRVRVPKDIAVVGFDNYIEAQQRDLTSYDFGFERAVHAIVNFACDPRAAHVRRCGGRVAIDGSVVRRGSTG